MATYNCSVDGWRNRQGAAWYPSSGFKDIGSSTGASQYIASNPSGTNKYAIVLRIKTPNYAGIGSIEKISVSFSMYKGNTTSGTLYGSLRTDYSDLNSSDTKDTYRENAIGSEASATYASTSYGTFTFEFSGDFAVNTYYYLVLYSKSNSDMFFTAYNKISPSAVATYTPKVFYINYDANGGSNAPGSQLKIYGESISITSEVPTPPEATTTTSTENFDITYNANGGYFGNASITVGTKTATKNIETTTTYAFSHWNTARDGSGTTYKSGASYAAEANATLYAIYTTTTEDAYSYENNMIYNNTPAPKKDNVVETAYTITFDANGGSCDTATLTNQKITTYSLYGWGIAAVSTPMAVDTTVSEAITVYACWKSSESYSAIALPTPTRKGYKYLGWAKTADAETADYKPGVFLIVDVEIPILYAVWELDNSLIHYNDNGNDVLCAVYYNDNGTAVLCNVYFNDNGTAVRI